MNPIRCQLSELLLKNYYEAQVEYETGSIQVMALVILMSMALYITRGGRVQAGLTNFACTPYIRGHSSYCRLSHKLGLGVTEYADVINTKNVIFLRALHESQSGNIYT